MFTVNLTSRENPQRSLLNDGKFTARMTDTTNLSKEMSLQNISMTTEVPIPVKVVVCGESGDGKTSLILRLVGDSFTSDHFPTRQPEWIGQNMLLNCVEYEVIIVDNTSEYRSDSQDGFIYKNRDVVFVCFDPRSPDAKAHIKKWVDIADQHRPEHSKLVLVATKCDLWDNDDNPPIDLVSDENSDALCAEFHAESLWKTLSLTNTNVHELFSHVTELAP